jgi:site-specific DNA recombinase
MYNNLFADNAEWKAVGYARVSSEDKDHDISDSIINQSKIIERYAEKNDDVKLINIYTDDGYTGTNFNRPSFIKMLSEIKSGEINCIIVKDLSRFGREIIQVCSYLQNTLPSLGVRFISIGEHMDSYTQYERMTSMEIPMLSMIHECYASDTSRKTKLSLNAKKEKGHFVGCCVPYGYLRSESNKYELVIDNAVEQNVKSIFQMYIDGKSIVAIVDWLINHNILSPLGYAVNIGTRKLPKNSDKDTYVKWSKSTVKNILSNQIYTGDMVQGKSTNYSYKNKATIKLPPSKWIVVKNIHEPIIDHNTFSDVQSTLVKNRKPRFDNGGKTPPSILNGLVYCGDCGKLMVRHIQTYNESVYKTFLCSSYKKHGKKVCSSHRVNEDVIIQVAFFTIQSHALALKDTNTVLENMSIKKKIAKTVAFYESEIERLKYDLEENHLHVEYLYKDYRKNLLTEIEFKRMNQKAKAQGNTIEEKISALQHKISKTDVSNMEYSKHVAEFIKSRTLTKLTRSIVVSLIERIVIYEEREVKIIFKYEDMINNLTSIFAND